MIFYKICVIISIPYVDLSYLIMRGILKLNEIATKTEQGTVVVIEKDGQWFVSADKTNIEY